MVGGPAHGPRVDVVQLAACARARGALVTLAILEELLLAMSHRRSVNQANLVLVHHPTPKLEMTISLQPIICLRRVKEQIEQPSEPEK